MPRQRFEAWLDTLEQVIERRGFEELDRVSLTVATRSSLHSPVAARNSPRYGGSVALLNELTACDEPEQVVARALIFRLAIDGLFAMDHPGAFWSAAIARDLADAQPLVEYLPGAGVVPTKLRGLFAIALGFAACRSGDALERTTGEAPAAASPTAASAVGVESVVPLAPSPAPSAAPEADVEYSIVWGPAANRYAAESFLLEWRSQELTVLGKHSGQIVAAGGGIYRWKQTSGKGVGMHDCGEAWNPGPEPNRKNRFVVEVKGAKVERLDATGEVEIVGIAAVENVGSFSNTVSLDASVGPYLFYSEWEDSTYCTAAHNSSTFYANVYDLAKRAPLEFPTKTDERLLLLEARQLPKADQDRCGEAVKAAGTGGPLSTDGLSLESVVPRWTKKRGLFFELGLATMSSYWMGKHGCTVSVSHVPPTLEPLSVPMAFAALSKKLPGFTVGGWSTLPSTDADAIAAARRIFRNR